MPRANWDVQSSDVDDFDRDSQFRPYDGPIPPNGVYHWRIKVMKFMAATRDKLPQLRLGLELVPRDGRKEERPYKGYFIMAFISISNKTTFRYVPLLDALGVTGRDFANRTITDAEGNIRKIGQWRNDGEQMVAGQLQPGTDQNGNAKTEIGFIGAIIDDEDSDDEEFEDGDDDEEEEEF